MKITVIQHDVQWENRNANLSTLDKILIPLYGQTDMVILTEMFSTGFTMNTGLAEEHRGKTFSWMKDHSLAGNFGVCGSLIIKEKGRCYNRFVFVSPEGEFHYDKRHLFSIGGEDKIYTKGSKRLIFNFRGFRISTFICYDLRFPVWSRNCDNYDLAVYVSSWPGARSNVWNTLLKARAIENQCFVAGSNRIGTDGNGILHSGMSQILNPRGEVIKSAEESACTITAEILMEELTAFRGKFNVLRDADDFTINL